MNNFISTKHNITKIVLACYVAPNTGRATHNNRPSHGLAFNCGGEKTYTFSNGKQIVINKNDFIYLPKNSSYEVNSKNSSGNTYCINFLIDTEEIFEPFSLHMRNASEVISAYQNAEKAWRTKKEGFVYLCKAELYKILYLLSINSNIPYSPNTKKEVLKPAISFIHKHFTSQTINVENLSQLCGISYEYFRKLFNLYYGCSPIKYINQLKLNNAKELLHSGFYTVTEVASLSGFVDVSYFSRFFKKQVGVAPNDFLKQIIKF